jgi:glyoxylase-like metal-dependent hydrolase (beta-lactamase superfamily II)
MIRLAENIWYTEPVSETDRPILAIIKGGAKALMIDGANCPNHARQFLVELEKLHLPGPDFIATTHSHCDHVFGLSVLSGLVVSNSVTNENIRRLNTLSWNDAEVAERVERGREHEMTARMLKDEMPGDRTGFRVREPQIIYERKLVIDLGETSCHLEKIGGDHATDSTVAFVPEQRVLFVGDCLYLRDKDRPTIEALVEKLLAFDAELYIDSHESQPITRKQLESRDFKLADWQDIEREQEREGT